MIKKKKAQSTLELTLSFIVIAMLLFGMIKVFSWSVRCIVGRDKGYTKDWKNEFDSTGEFYKPPKIKLVPELIK